MKGYLAFTKKEFIENIKNFRLLILFAVLLLFGALSPFLARYMPDIVERFAPGMEVLDPDPSALDSWKEFYKNISGVGFSAFIILYGNCLSHEYAKGTLVLMVTKGLPRTAVILSKYTAAAVIMTAGYWLSFGAAYGGTAYLWSHAAIPHTVFAAFALWVLGFLYLSILMLGCVLFRQAFSSILFAGGVVALLGLAGIPEQLAPFSPSVLSVKNVELLEGTASASEFIAPVAITVLLSVGFLYAAIQLFRKKQLS